MGDSTTPAYQEKSWQNKDGTVKTPGSPLPEADRVRILRERSVRYLEETATPTQQGASAVPASTGQAEISNNRAGIDPLNPNRTVSSQPSPNPDPTRKELFVNLTESYKKHFGSSMPEGSLGMVRDAIQAIPPERLPEALVVASDYEKDPNFPAYARLQSLSEKSLSQDPLLPEAQTGYAATPSASSSRAAETPYVSSPSTPQITTYASPAHNKLTEEIVKEIRKVTKTDLSPDDIAQIESQISLVPPSRLREANQAVDAWKKRSPNKLKDDEDRQAFALYSQQLGDNLTALSRPVSAGSTHSTDYVSRGTSYGDHRERILGARADIAEAQANSRIAQAGVVEKQALNRGLTLEAERNYIGPLVAAKAEATLAGYYARTALSNERGAYAGGGGGFWGMIKSLGGIFMGRTGQGFIRGASIAANRGAASGGVVGGVGGLIFGPRRYS